jgi:hypothetical protein
MFQKSSDAYQQDMFSCIPTLLMGESLNQYNDERAWQNVFRREIVERVDESLFKPLYDSNMGAPNASIRLLIGMLAIKEGCGWSDRELFEQCRFNLLVRNALGLFNLSDEIPVESTYYLFRKRLHEYQKRTDIDLIEVVFKQITKEQVIDYQVSGGSIRMDSKLINSNIAWCSRYEIIHNTVALFCKSMKEATYKKLKQNIKVQIDGILKTDSQKVVYQLEREKIYQKLQELGYLIYQLVSLEKEKGNPYYSTLLRVYREQYSVNGEKIELREKEEISSSSVQSPHDTECSYREKNGESVKGYSANITETCDKEGLNLIVDVSVRAANASDVDFLQPAIKSSEEVLEGKPEELHADGAFQSPENVEFCKEENITPYFTGIQGNPGRYDLSLEGEELTVIDTQTGESIKASKVKSKKSGKRTEKWYIITSEGKKRYFTKKEIETSKLRKQIANMPVEKRNMRNNVEATIFQFAYYTNNSKTRYRGIYKNKMWAIMRCIWINMKRIAEYIITRGRIVEQKKEKITKTAHFIKNYLKNFIRDVKFFPSTLFSAIFATFPKNYRFS